MIQSKQVQKYTDNKKICDITVDPFSKASAGMVRLVVNAYFDATMIRPEAFQFGTFQA